MSFLFVYVCDLLEKLEMPHLGEVPLLPAKLQEYTNLEAIKWFQLHNSKLSDFGINSDALVLMLRPENSTDRDYGLDAETLELVIARILQLSRPDYLKLQRWQREPHLCDLGLCAAEVIETSKRAPAPSKGNKVTVEEIDRCLLRIAAHHPNSSPAVQSLAAHWKQTDAIDLLGNIFSRLRSREAKWLIRYILNEYGPVKVPEILRPDSSHSGLPNFLGVSVDLFPSLAPVTAYRDGTMIIKGIDPPTTTRLECKLARPLYPKSLGKEVSSNDIYQDKLPKSPTCNLYKHDMAVSNSRNSQTLQGSSQLSEPIIFQRGLLKPRKPVEKRGLATNRVAKTPSKNNSAARSSENSSLSKSSAESGSANQILAPSSNLRTPSPPRPALGQISANASFSSGSPSRRSSQLISSPYKPRNPLQRAGSGQCQMTSTTCPLTRCILLLSPCISKSPRILDNLLQWHGALYLTSLSALTSPHLPAHCPTTRKNYRKIVLVDMYDRQATADFLCKIEDLQLQQRVKRGKRDGKGRKWDKEWVEVYDWRLLECMAKIDQGKELGYDAWKRCFLCVV